MIFPSEISAIILLGTYNGERFLDNQIRSVQNQTFQNWQMYIRDDGSVDRTTTILNKYKAIDDRIHIVIDNKGNLGTLGNYNELCIVANNENADIVFFCDQDDLWLPHKIEFLIEAIEAAENKYGKNCPILVHSDLVVVDSNLKLISNSFLSYKHIGNFPIAPLNVLLAQNNISGCAIAFNRALLDFATPIPMSSLVHDWWFSLCAAACGQIIFINKPTTLYRLHSNNTIGVKNQIVSAKSIHKQIQIPWYNGYMNFLRSIQQSEELLKRIRGRNRTVHPGTLTIIKAYGRCLKQGRLRRIQNIRKNNIRRQSIIYNILFYILLLSIGKE